MPKLSDVDEWLLSAINDSPLTAVTKALDRGANVNVMDEKGCMPIHYAVRKGDKELVKLLIARGADINLVDKEFKTSIEIASEQKQGDMLQLLIEARKPFCKASFEKFVQYCCDQYIRHTKDIEVEKKNQGLLAHYASRMVGKNVGELLTEKNNVDRYVVHLFSFSLAKKRGEKLEGWRAEEFLSLRIHTFFEILVKSRLRVLAYQENQGSLLKELETEILHEIETLRIVRDRLAIVRCALADSKEFLFNSLAQQVGRKVADLNPQAVLTVHAGYVGHTLYVTFFATNNGIEIHIDNLGDGSERHQVIDGTNLQYLGVPLPTLIHSFPLGLFDKALFKESNHPITTYIAKLLSLKDSVLEDKSKAALDVIYDTNRTLFGLRKSVPESKALQEEQIADNCVTANHNVGLFTRFTNQHFVRWLLSRERQCVVVEERAEYAKQASSPAYWDEVEIKHQAQDFSRYCQYDSLDAKFGETISHELITILLPLAYHLYDRNYQHFLFRHHQRPFTSHILLFTPQEENNKPAPLHSFFDAAIHDEKNCSPAEKFVLDNTDLQNMMVWLQNNNFDELGLCCKTHISNQTFKDHPLGEGIVNLLLAISMVVNNLHKEADVYKKALECLEKVLVIFAEEGIIKNIVFLIKGMILGSLGLTTGSPTYHQKAIESLERVTENSSPACRRLQYFNIAIAYHKTGDYTNAGKFYLKSKKLYEEFIEQLYGKQLVRYFFANNAFLFQFLIKKLYVSHCLGFLYLDSDKVPEADSALQESLRDAALRDLSSLPLLLPFYANSFYAFGMIYFERGKKALTKKAQEEHFAEARKSFNLCLRHDPDHADAQQGLIDLGAEKVDTFSKKHVLSVRGGKEPAAKKPKLAQPEESKGAAGDFAGASSSAGSGSGSGSAMPAASMDSSSLIGSSLFPKSKEDNKVSAEMQKSLGISMDLSTGT